MSAYDLDFYVDPDDGKEWSMCPSCNHSPRVWIFDNGSYAACACNDLAKPYSVYHFPSVTSENIMAVYKRTGTTAEYDRDNLRIMWNDEMLLRKATLD